MLAPVPFVGAKRSLYESGIFDSTTLKYMGRRTAINYLDGLPKGTWVIRHSSFQNLLMKSNKYTTSFSEDVEAFFAISVQNVRTVDHFLIAQVDEEYYYYLYVNKKNHLTAINKKPLHFKDLLDFMDLSASQQEAGLEGLSKRDYINL
jgi:hypothetical protein